jgi:hypothetical protein
MGKVKYMSGAEFKARFKAIIDVVADDDQVTFGGGDLSFHRYKIHDPKADPAIINIQFNEAYTVVADPDDVT